MSAHGPMPRSARMFPALAILLFAIVTVLGYGFAPSAGGFLFAVVLLTILFGTVFAAVHHAEVIAHRSGRSGRQLVATTGRIHPTTSYEGFGDVDFVIEAVPERMAIKQAVFAELDAYTPGHAILASNTSSLSISEIADATLRPEKVVGFHYFYPASVMPLVEIVEGEETSAETVAAAVTFAQAIRKQAITCAEVPGFVVNRTVRGALLLGAGACLLKK